MLLADSFLGFAPVRMRFVVVLRIMPVRVIGIVNETFLVNLRDDFGVDAIPFVLALAELKSSSWSSDIVTILNCLSIPSVIVSLSVAGKPPESIVVNELVVQLLMLDTCEM